MNSILKRILTLTMIGGIQQFSFGQASNGLPIPNNLYSPIGYLGWSNNGINPLLFKTNNTNRMKLNGNVSYPINGHAGARNGNLLIGISNTSLNTGQNIYTGNSGAFSLLHINGPGSVFQEFGYRPWMQTGITLTGNSDLSYFGLRKLSTIVTQEDIFKFN